MNTPRQQAELYRKAAETIDMCECHLIEPKFKHNGEIFILIGHEFSCAFDRYEFPVAVIKGRIVWAGDKLWYNETEYSVDKGSFKHTVLADWSWNPPKRTVLVELRVEDARYIANTGAISVELHTACRKALDNLRGEAN